MTSQNRPAPRPFRTLALAFVLGAATCLLGFAFGRWSAPAPAPAAADEAVAIRAEVARAVAEAVARLAPPVPVAAAPLAASPAPVTAAEMPPPARAPQGPAPEVVARAREDARGEIEALREYITSRCWPRGGIAGGRTSAKVVFNLTFDPSGRELARGVGEDRRAPAGEFGACLRNLAGIHLSIPSPGTTVAFSIPFAFP